MQYYLFIDESGTSYLGRTDVEPYFVLTAIMIPKNIYQGKIITSQTKFKRDYNIETKCLHFNDVRTGRKEFKMCRNKNISQTLENAFNQLLCKFEFNIFASCVFKDEYIHKVGSDKDVYYDSITQLMHSIHNELKGDDFVEKIFVESRNDKIDKELYDAFHIYLINAKGRNSKEIKLKIPDLQFSRKNYQSFECSGLEIADWIAYPLKRYMHLWKDQDKLKEYKKTQHYKVILSKNPKITTIPHDEWRRSPCVYSSPKHKKNA